METAQGQVTLWVVNPAIEGSLQVYTDGVAGTHLHFHNEDPAAFQMLLQ